MKKNNILSKSILVVLVVLGVILYALVAFVNIKKGQLSATIIEENDSVVKSIIEKFNSVYIKEENNKIYIDSINDLYDISGNSNEYYFLKLVEALGKYYNFSDFYIIDEKKEIEIYAKADNAENEYFLIINGYEDYYSRTDGNSYSKVDSSKIVDLGKFDIDNQYLKDLEENECNFKIIEKRLGKAVQLENDYNSYQNDTIRVRTVSTGNVKNIIFRKGYEESIINGIKVGTSLREISDILPNNVLGSIEKGYLGYREREFYIFFYNDEVSVYTYSYKINKEFENIFNQYLEDKNLDRFALRLKSSWGAYDKFEYDEVNRNLYAMYSTRGAEIIIKSNNPSQTTLYSNYHFSVYTKKIVKNGIIKFKPDEDLVENYEKERRS